MAKDPAVLFYTSDFLTGTRFMSYEQIGKYITLLCLQQQQGHLSNDDMRQICEPTDDRVLKKFVQDEQGLYYNKRMDKEVVKRQNYTKSRLDNLDNGKKDAHMEHDMDKHMDDHMENENIDININKTNKRKGGTGERRKKAFIPPALEEVQAYCKQRDNNVDPKKFWEYFNAGDWVDSKGNPVRNWKQKVITWENSGQGRGSPQKPDTPKPEIKYTFGGK